MTHADYRKTDCTALRGSVTMTSMPSSAAQTAKTKTLTKREVIDFLGKSKRTVEIYIHDGRLPCQYFNGPNGKTAVFDRAAVEALKRDLDTPTVRAVPAGPQTTSTHVNTRHDMNGEALALRSVSSGDPLALLTTALARFVPAPAPVIKPWLTLSEAVDYSGLPSTYLVQAARAGTIRAVNVGTGEKAFWRFNREGLSK